MSETRSKIPLKLHEVSVLYGKRVAIDGRLGGMTRKDFEQLVDAKGGSLVDLNSPKLDLLVVGAESLTPSPETRHIEADRIAETELWQSLGYIETEAETGRLYTPAMLADLLCVPVASIRRWHRRGLIHPVREVKKLALYDFEEVASARRIARLIASGQSPSEIEARLSELNSQRPLSQLSVIVQGKDVLLRHGDGLVEPGGQQVFAFETFDEENEEPPEILSLSTTRSEVDLPGESNAKSESSFVLQSDHELEVLASEDLIELAVDLEDEGDLQGAIECYRTILVSRGSSADMVFRLAELLYQSGDLSASKERYYNAIELEPSFIEARASLGCVLMELGETELAIGAFQGALDQHRDYPDVHFHLAKLLSETGRREQAVAHWDAFLQLAPKSPWAEEAKARLSEISG